MTATLEDGRPAIVTMTPGAWELDVPPASRPGEDAGSFQITVSAEDEADYVRKKLARFERDNPGFTWQVVDRNIAPKDPLKVSFPFSMPVTLWPRLCVKVALTVGRTLNGEQWLRSVQGLLLNRLLWDREETVRMNPLPTKRTFWAASGWTPPPNHVVLVMPSPTPMVLITLFGEDSYAVPIAGTVPVDGTAWVLHTLEGRCERTSADDFITQIVAATTSQQPDWNPLAEG